jgi:hypothetical protein
MSTSASMTSVGGLIYVSAQVVPQGPQAFALLVQNSTFINNTALNLFGGCIAFDNLSKDGLAIIRNNVFLNNTASAGAAWFVKATTHVPQATNNTFGNSRVSLYGPNYATGKKETLVQLLGAQPYSGETLDLLSGASIPPITITEQDYYGQNIILGLLNARFAILSISQNGSHSNKAMIVGDTKRMLIEQTTTFGQFKLYAEAPPPVISLDTDNNSTQATNSYNITVLEVNIRGEPLEYLQTIPIRIRPCSLKESKEEVAIQDSSLKECKNSKCRATVITHNVSRIE